MLCRGFDLFFWVGMCVDDREMLVMGLVLSDADVRLAGQSYITLPADYWSVAGRWSDVSEQRGGTLVDPVHG